MVLYRVKFHFRGLVREFLFGCFTSYKTCDLRGLISKREGVGWGKGIGLGIRQFIKTNLCPPAQKKQWAFIASQPHHFHVPLNVTLAAWT